MPTNPRQPSEKQNQNPARTRNTVNPARAQDTGRPAGDTSRPFPTGLKGVLLTPGARPLPDFELVRMLGRGGFGEVWKASGPGGIDVALKFVRLGEQSAAVELRPGADEERTPCPPLAAVRRLAVLSGRYKLVQEVGEGAWARCTWPSRGAWARCTSLVPGSSGK
jgi:hypothetical protein